VELAGKQINTEVTMLASLWRDRDADHLAGTTLENQQIANANEVTGDLDGIWWVTSTGLDDTDFLTHTFTITCRPFDRLLFALMVMVERMKNAVRGTLNAAAEGVVLTVVVVVTHFARCDLFADRFFNSDFGGNRGFDWGGSGNGKFERLGNADFSGGGETGTRGVGVYFTTIVGFGTIDFGVGLKMTRMRSVNVYFTTIVGIGTISFGAWLRMTRMRNVNVYFTTVVGIGTISFGAWLRMTRMRSVDVYFTKIVGIGAVGVGVWLGVTRTSGFNVYLTEIVGVSTIRFGLWLVATVVGNVDFVGRIDATAIFTFSDVELGFECLVVSRATIFDAVETVVAIEALGAIESLGVVKSLSAIKAVGAIESLGVVKSLSAIEAVGAANRLLVTFARKLDLGMTIRHSLPLPLLVDGSLLVLETTRLAAIVGAGANVDFFLAVGTGVRQDSRGSDSSIFPSDARSVI
jgi:hypothetical protein